LLLKAAVGDEKIAPAAWRELKPNLDLDRLPAPSLRLLPLVYSNLTAKGIEDPEMPRLKGLYRHTWYKNHLLLHRGGETLRTLQRAGIPTLVLKGPALIAHYYGDAGVRPMLDFDVLIPRTDARRSLDVLTGAGWQGPRFAPPGLPRFLHGIDLQDGDGMECDVHWRVMEYLVSENEEGSEKGFWSRAIEVSIGGAMTRSLGHEDQLLHVCVHGARWNPDGNIRWVCDAMTVVIKAGKEIDWGVLPARCRDYGCAVPMHDALRYLRNEFGAPIPADVLEELSGIKTNRRARFGYRALARRPAGPGWWRTTYRIVAHYARMTSGWGIGRAVLGFPRFLQESWNLDRLWRVPFVGVSKGLRRFRSSPAG
jgi:hypothetical protein